MKVRFYIDVVIPEENIADMSESMDLTIYGNNLVEKLIEEADSCDDLPLMWEEIKPVLTGA